MDRTDITVITVSCMALTAQLWGQGLPERSTVYDWPATPESVGRVHQQSTYSGGAALLVAAGASWAAKSWWPILGAGLLVAYLGGSYSAAARSGPRTPPPSPPPKPSVRWIP